VNRLARIPAPWLVVGAVVVAIAVNVGIHALGRLAGATYRFTAATGPAEVDSLTVLGFTLLPLGIALTLVAVLGRFWKWVFPVALVVGPVLELGSILGMPLPTDLDVASKIALSLCHVVLVPVTVLTVLALRRRAQLSESRESVDVSSTKVALSES
jgi:hypothetical protein